MSEQEHPAHVVLWKRDDGLKCLGLKRPAQWRSPNGRYELQVRRGARIIKKEMFGSCRKAVTTAMTVWSVDFGVGAKPRVAA